MDEAKRAIHPGMRHVPAPHGGRPVLAAGAPLERAAAALVLVHGRGGSARDMLALAREVAPAGVACLAPQAAGQSWYPFSFLAPIERNEPALSSGLAVLSGLIAETERAVPAERIVLLGFSQGACLALEHAARNARRLGAVVGLSGGLIGPPGTPRDYAGSFAGTPVFLGCGDVDPHIPLERVAESAEVYRRLGAEVTERIYPGFGHAVNQDEMEFVRGLAAGLVDSPAR
jgi:predicted esterase